MGRKCRVCSTEHRNEIDEAVVKGSSLSDLSAIYQITEDALARHRDGHLSATLLKAQEAQEIARADGLLAETRGLQSITLRTLARAEQAGDSRIVLSALREARNNLAFLQHLTAQSERAKQTGDTSESSREWITVRSAILKAVEPYPKARLAIMEAMGDEKQKD